MKPAAFEYHAPTTQTEATALLAEYGDEAKVLAGGQSLVPMLALRLARVPHLVDLGRIEELSGVEHVDGVLHVRAMTTQRELQRVRGLATVPLLDLAIPHVGHFQIRNRGTVGGSIAHADAAGELPAVALALSAEIDIASATGGIRTESAADFFQGMWTTTVQPDELVTAVRFPTWTGATGFAVYEVARRHGDFAMTGAVCGVEVGEDGRVARAALALMGMGSTPVRCTDVESALVGRAPTGADLVEIGELAVRSCDPPDDIHASSRYRRVVGAAVVTRAFASALARASGREGSDA